MFQVIYGIAKDGHIITDIKKTAITLVLPLVPLLPNLCILWGAVLWLHALSCSILSALWLWGGLASTTGLDEWPALSLQLDVCCQAH